MKKSLGSPYFSAVVVVFLISGAPCVAQEVKGSPTPLQTEVAAPMASELPDDLLPQGDPVFKLENCDNGSWLHVAEWPADSNSAKALKDKTGIQAAVNVEGRLVASIIGTYWVPGEDTSALKDWAQWKIIRGDGEFGGLFKLQNAKSQGSISVRQFEPPSKPSAEDREFLREWQGRPPYFIVDHHYGEPGGKSREDSPRHWWKIIVGEGDKKGCFRLENAGSETWLFPNFPLMVCGAEGSACGKDEEMAFWRFRFSDMKVIGVEYFHDRGEVLSSKPVVAGDSCVNNTQSSVEQHSAFVVDKTVEHTSSFQHERGIELEAGLEFSVGVTAGMSAGVGPISASVEASTETTTSFGITEKVEHSWGSETKYSHTYQTSFPLTAVPGKCYVAVATVREARLQVPYKLILEVAGGTGTVASYDTWTGVTTMSLGYSVKELGPDETCPCGPY